MEIRSPALHSALGRGLLCLSPPPSPQLLSSPSISTIWCLLMAVSSPLQAPYSSSGLPCSVHPSKHCSSHPSSSSNPIPSLLPSYPYPFTHPSAASLWFHLRPGTLNFHSHWLGSTSSSTSDSFTIMIPLSLLLSFPQALCWAFIADSLPSALSFFVQSLYERQSAVRSLFPTHSQQENF